MNRLKGTIKEIETEGHLSLVRLSTASGNLSCIVIDTPESCPYLKEGREVKILFKETEVAIGLSIIKGISLQNQIAGHITQIDEGKLLARIVLDTASGSVTAIITSRASKQLQLSQGLEVLALIKTNEIMLAE